jgi:hypothetical protein
MECVKIVNGTPVAIETATYGSGNMYASAMIAVRLAMACTNDFGYSTDLRQKNTNPSA